MSQPTTDAARLSDDCRALLDLLDGLDTARIEFERCQFQLWDHADEDGPTLLLLSVQREHVLHAATSPGQGNGHDPAPVCQLTGDVVAWDFEAENGAYHQPLLRFICFDELRTWLLERA